MELFSLLAKLTADTSEFHSELEKAKSEADNLEIDDPKVGLDTEEFESNAASAESVGKGFGTSMEEVFNGIKTALTVTGIVTAISGIVSGLREAVNMTAQTADGIDKGSARLNISKRKYQEWDHALRQSGASINDLQKGVIQFNQYVSSFEPGAVVENAEEAAEGAGGEMANAFARLKISVKDANGQLKSTETLIEESLIALAGFEGSKEERGTLVNTLFGRGATSLNALLDSGVAGVKELLGEADKLGLIMSDEEITNAVEYGDAVANLNEELAAVKSAFVSDIIPVLRDGTKFLTDLLSKFNPRLRENSLTQTFDSINDKTQASILSVDRATVSAKKLVEDLENLGDYWTLDEEGRMTWDALAAKALELFPQLSEYIDTDGKKIQGNTQDIEKNIEAWARLEKQRILSAALEEKSVAVADKLTKAYKKGAEARENEAYAAGVWATTLQEVNKLREQRGLEAFAEGTTYEQYRAWYNEYGKGANRRNYKKLGLEDFANATKEYENAAESAENLRKEANKMKGEAEEAQKSLGDYEKYLGEEMGLTEQEILSATQSVQSYKDELNSLPSDVYTTIHQEYVVDDLDAPPKAIGSRFIPNDMLVYAHRGEEIRTATQARQDNNGRDYDIAEFENAMIRAVERGMSQAQVNAYVTDREVARGTNRFNGGEIDSGRFRP